MARLVALLRGINLGRSRRVAMADLRELLEDLGYEDVRTHLQSGNAVLTTGDRPAVVAEAIAAGMAERFGMDVSVSCGRRGSWRRWWRPTPSATSPTTRPGAW